MELVCLGLNHRTAPVEVRERFAVGNTKLGEAAREIASIQGVAEGVVVSTCNRTEFYFAADEGGETLSRIEHTLVERHGLDDTVRDHFYRKEKADAAEHLCRVVSGLDSMVLGETEIFGQVKQAYKAALEAGTTGGFLNRLFQKSFGVGKKVRTETSIQEGATSIGNVAVDLAEKIFGHLKDSEVMILGAGEMSRLTAQALVSRGARGIFVTNRSYDRAVELAKETGGSAVRFDEWQKVLERVDVVISSTGAPHAIVHREEVEKVRRARKFRPLFFIDIAVPRDIDPAVGEIEEVYLYDIDTLEQLAEEARSRRQRQIEECERIIESELAKMNLPGT
ncbi:glutamyl-tRNA reductase [Luteolibacter ambystomatis]|uniref:Glutamyl-tRNA reductase n=1 Tax=Luteolibacter ambystomatis TaxID=2824561 RepID=A0A975PFG3_9BACT|nr:glutamyl-tRNA reductase [Luteolibacter ambystomatis]QUE51880.1 glutamyl-tRNA reductase [Luteolibacter ambystomatis]